LFWKGREPGHKEDQLAKTGQTAKRVDPLATLRFHVEIQGIEEAAFSECSGLQAETEVFPYEEGGLNSTVHQLPVRTKFSNVTLKRGIANSNELWDWYYKVITGSVERKNVSLVLYSSDYSEVMRWNLANVFPVKWVGPNLVSSDNSVAVETLELAHEGIEVSVQPKKE
jgi:phage tail-like protein